MLKGGFMKIYITRHGQTKWNVEGRMQGQLNSDLTEKGINQAKWLGEFMQEIEIDVIISSSSGRAYDTANLIRGNRDIKIIKSDNLREMYLGEWEGRIATEIRISDKEQQDNFWNSPHQYKPSSGESYEELKCRVNKELTNIITEFKNKTVLIVTHAITLKTILAYIKNLEIKDIWSGTFMHPTCLNEIEVCDGVMNIINEGDISHYR
jgi:probable phosphoglycerate mutase